MQNNFKIKSRDNQLLGQVFFELTGIKIVSEDIELVGLIEEKLKNGIKKLGHGARGSIVKTDPLFPVALADYLRKNGFIVDEWDSIRNEIRLELEKYPKDDEYVVRLGADLESMQNLELSYLLKLLKSKEL